MNPTNAISDVIYQIFTAKPAGVDWKFFTGVTLCRIPIPRYCVWLRIEGFQFPRSVAMMLPLASSYTRSERLPKQAIQNGCQSSSYFVPFGEFLARLFNGNWRKRNSDYSSNSAMVVLACRKREIIILFMVSRTLNAISGYSIFNRLNFSVEIR